MKSRIAEIVKYTNLNQTDFATKMGWSQQYLHRLLTGVGGVGITPIAALLQEFPEIDARWLVLGTGNMFGRTAKDMLSERVYGMLSLEKYIPYMTEEEQKSLSTGFIDFPADRLNEWSRALHAHESFINNKFPSYAKSR